MEGFKIQRIGPHYYVLEYKVVNFDSVLDRDWQIVHPAHNTKKEAEDHPAQIGGAG